MHQAVLILRISYSARTCSAVCTGVMAALLAYLLGLKLMADACIWTANTRSHRKETSASPAAVGNHKCIVGEFGDQIYKASKKDRSTRPSSVSCF